MNEDEVQPAARLQGDLGAESIDYLALVFRLEQEFGVKIPRGELFPESIFRGDPEFVQDGKVTPKGPAELRSKIPFADLTEFEKDPTMNDISAFSSNGGGGGAGFTSWTERPPRSSLKSTTMGDGERQWVDLAARVVESEMPVSQRGQ